jgi:hypothetical protein
MTWGTRRDLAACFVCKQVRLGFGLKNGGGMVQMVHVASSWRLHQGQVEDGRVDATGCVGPYYSCFAVFIILSPRGVLVF